MNDIILIWILAYLFVLGIWYVTVSLYRQTPKPNNIALAGVVWLTAFMLVATAFTLVGVVELIQGSLQTPQLSFTKAVVFALLLVDSNVCVFLVSTPLALRTRLQRFLFAGTLLIAVLCFFGLALTL